MRLLIAGANQVFHSFGGIRPLALFKFRDPIGDGVDDVVGSLANGLRFVTLAVNALSAFDYFYFFLGHKHIRRAVCNLDKRKIWLKVPAWLGCSPGKQLLDAAFREIVAERSEEDVKPVLTLGDIVLGFGFHVNLPKTPLGNIGEQAQRYHAAESHPGQRSL